MTNAEKPEDKPAALATKVPAPPIETDNEDPSRALNAFASAANFSTAQRIAHALSQSTLVPKEYQNNLPNVLIAMEIASRIGASVFMVMQHLDIIHGRPSWRAMFLIATVNASQRFTPLRFRWEGKRGEDTWGCRAVAKDRESGEECVGALVSWAMVNAEGWSTKSGSKWMTMPEQMFLYRAAAFWTRVYSPELSLGMQTSEETVDALPPLEIAPVRSLEEKIAASKLEPTPEPEKPKPGLSKAKARVADAELKAKADAAKAEVKPGDALFGAEQGGRAPIDPVPDIGKPKPETGTRRRTAPAGAAEACMICKKTIVGHFVETTSPDGEVGRRHHACAWPKGDDGGADDPDQGP